jgi:hypothetical protein
MSAYPTRSVVRSHLDPRICGSQSRFSDTQKPEKPRPHRIAMDLLSFYAKEALRARNLTEALALYHRCTWCSLLGQRAVGMAGLGLCSG